MAAVNNNLSNLLTNTYASIPVFNATGEDGNSDLYKFATCAIPTSATDSAGSTYRMVRVFSSDIPISIKISSTALTAGAVDVGLYLPDTGAEAATNSKYLVSTTVSLASAVVNVDKRFDNLSTTTIGQRWWQLLGLTSDPEAYYDLAFTSTTAATDAGTLSLAYQFTR